MNKKLYVDDKSNEIENLLSGAKKYIVKAANIKKYPYEMIKAGDTLFLLANSAKGIVQASCTVKSALFTDALSKSESKAFIQNIGSDIMMSKKRIAYLGERKYISLFEVEHVKSEYAMLDESLWKKQEDWVRVKPIK